MNIVHGRGYVYGLQYHIVFCVKYRKPILTGEAETRLRDIFSMIAEDNCFTIEEMNMDKDHVHLLISCSPQNYIPSMMKALKGVSAHKLFKQMPELKKELYKGHLWNPSYFVATVSENTETQIREYIRAQNVVNV